MDLICYSTFGQTSATTLICDSKQLKKLAAISTSLKTIQNVICFEDDESSKDTGLSESLSNLTVASFSEVERLGKTSPVPANLPSKNGIAVIMYTSGSTGLPKVGFLFAFFHYVSHIWFHLLLCYHADPKFIKFCDGTSLEGDIKCVWVGW